MMKSKEYKICVCLSIVCLVLYGVSMVMGLIPQLNCSIDKICLYLGNAFLGLSLVFLIKTKNNDGKEE